jgi:hypothetical protein
VTETDTYGFIAKLTAASGGMTITAVDESANFALDLVGVAGASGDTTKSTAGRGAVELIAQQGSGAGVADMGANANLVVVRNNATTRFILDADGDSHQDVGTAWTNFDDRDDVLALTALSAAVSRSGDDVRERFCALIDEHRDALVAAKLVSFGDDGRPFVNWSRTSMLLIGAVRQLGEALARTESRLAQIEAARG